MVAASLCIALILAISKAAATTASFEDRFLQDENATCAEDTEVQCRGKCLVAAEFGVSVEACASLDETLECINPRGQVSTGQEEGDFYPGCASEDAGPVTNFTLLPDYGEDRSACTDFEERFESKDGEYNQTIVLPEGKGALFQYSLIGGDTVKGRLAYNGLFGFLAFGFTGENPSAAMLGGKVIVAMRGDNYTASEGLDLDLGYKVDEFIINSTARAFRHWQKPYSDASDADFPGTVTSRDAHNRRLSKGSFKVNVTDDGCYTYLRFEIHDIGGQYFQFEGTDTFMWAANDVDTFMQHHMDNRGIFPIDWNNVGSTGEGEEGHGHAHGESNDHGAGDSNKGNTTSSSNTWKATVAGALLIASSAATLM